MICATQRHFNWNAWVSMWFVFSLCLLLVFFAAINIDKITGLDDNQCLLWLLLMLLFLLFSWKLLQPKAFKVCDVHLKKDIIRKERTKHRHTHAHMHNIFTENMPNGINHICMILLLFIHHHQDAVCVVCVKLSLRWYLAVYALWMYEKRVYKVVSDCLQ